MPSPTVTVSDRRRTATGRRRGRWVANIVTIGRVTSPSGQQPQSWYGPPPQPPYAAPRQDQPAWAGHPGSVPPPRQWQAPPGPPAVIETGRADSRRFVVASVVMLSLGLVATIGGAVEAAGGRMGGLIAIGFGVAFLAIGLVPVVNRKRMFRPRRLVIEQAGIRWDDPKGEPWSVQWQELTAVALNRHEAAEVGPEGLTDKVAGAAADRVLGKRVLVRLDLFPADPGFAQRHPEMAHLWTGDRLRLQLGHNLRLLPQMDAAIRHFQPNRYAGVQRTTQGNLKLR
jgi:hypothetical protein